MASVPLAPPPPVQDSILGRWLYLLWKRLSSSGQIAWDTVSFEGSVTSVATSTSMDDSYQTYVVTASGQTMTLPAASAARIGKTWTVNFATTGTVTIQRAGSDTIVTPTNSAETSVLVVVQGTSLDFRCKTATTWSIV